MKKLFPEAPDVPQGVANRAVRIIEKYFKIHRVERARDLPEEAKVRLYRDLRFLFEGDGGSGRAGFEGKGGSVRGLLSRLWEKIENFLSMAEDSRACGPATVLSWVCFGDTAQLAALPWSDGSWTWNQCG